MIWRKVLTGVSLVLLSAVQAEALETPNLDGVWEGDIRIDESGKLNVTEAEKDLHDVYVRLTIEGPVVAVAFKINGSWTDAKPGVFHISQVKTNAVIFGTNYSGDENEGWTETWSFIVTPKDDSTLITEYARLVNNSGFRVDAENVKLGVRGYGEMKRAARK
jgi:hypothetical protein